jgi:hypothetical protein
VPAHPESLRQRGLRKARHVGEVTGGQCCSWVLGGQVVIGRRREAARTAAAGSGNTSFPGFNPAAYEQQVIDEFDQLYAEGATRRRVMVTSARGSGSTFRGDI